MNWEPIDIAITQIGIREEGGKNDGIPADKYMQGQALEWCAGFVLWCYRHSDWDPLEDNNKEIWTLRSVRNMIDEFTADGTFFAKGEKEPQPNDLVFYSRPGGSGNHVGIVRSFDGVYIRAVEGNFQNQVYDRLTRLDSRKVKGFARPGPVNDKR